MKIVFQNNDLIININHYLYFTINFKVNELALQKEKMITEKGSEKGT